MERSDKLLLTGSAGSALLLMLIALLFFLDNTIVIGYLAIGAVMIMVFPYSMVNYLRVRTAKKMEDVFPGFLRDIAEAKRAGMTLVNAIRVSAETDYGALTPEIIRMRNGLSWGVPFPTTLESFSKRARYSTYIQRGIAILLESYYAGGDVAATMEAVANSTREIKEIEKDRESVLSQQLMIIYIIHFIFIGILVALYAIMIPMLTLQSVPSGGLGGLGGGVGGEAPKMEYYKLLFFLAMTIQSLANGVVAGETKEGSASAGIKHAGIMISVSLFAFALFIFPKTYTLNAVTSKTEVNAGEMFEIYGHVSLEGEAVSNTRVTIILAGESTTGFTDEYGDYTIEVKAPNVEGAYNIEVSSSYETFSAVNTLGITVT